MMPVKPAMGEDNVPRTYAKASLRYQSLVQKHGLPRGKPQPRRIPCTEILPSHLNRLGRPLNIQYIHQDLAPSIQKEGFNPDRAQIGMVVRRTQSDRLGRLHAHSIEMHKAMGDMLPPLVVNEHANKECLGGNHLTMTLRMYNSAYKSPITGAACVIGEDDIQLQLAASSKTGEGHLCWELDDDILDEDCTFLSEMLNADQNQNQCNSEDHLRRTMQCVLDRLMTAERPHVPTSKVVDIVTKESLVKVRSEEVGDTAQLVASLGPYNNELHAWYGENVNPRELTISPRWMGELSRAWGSDITLCKLAACFLQYRGISKLEQTRPTPDISRTIDGPLVNALGGKNKENLIAMEELLRSNRVTFEAYLAERCGHRTAVKMFHAFEELSIRLLCGKTLIMGIPHKVSGKWSLEKAKELQAAWVQHIVRSRKDIDDMIVKFDIGRDDNVEEKEDVVRARRSSTTYCHRCILVCSFMVFFSFHFKMFAVFAYRGIKNKKQNNTLINNNACCY